MSNHPHQRPRRDDGPADSVPAAPLPPGFSPNGHGTQAAQIGNAVGQVLAEQLPRILFGAVAAALQQVLPQCPVTVKPLHCATCMLERLRWAAAHGTEFRAADEAWRAAVAEQEGKPPEDRVPVDPAAFIPGQLRAGAPPVQDGTVMIGGTLYCMQHVPGAPGPGASQLLVAQAHITPAMMAELRGHAA